MSCEFGEQVSMLMDGELPADAQAEIRDHLASCTECQLMQRDFLLFRVEIGKLSGVAYGAPGRQMSNARLSFWKRAVSVPVPAVAAVLFVAVVAGIGLLRFWPSPIERVDTMQPTAVAATAESKNDLISRFDKGGRAEIVVVSRAEGAK